MITNPLPAEFRTTAADRRSEGDEHAARIYEICANRVETYERERALECLTLNEAAGESGFSVSHLGRLVSEGRVPNAGERYSPRIRREDLPRKPGACGPKLLGKARGENG